MYVYVLRCTLWICAVRWICMMNMLGMAGCMQCHLHFMCTYHNRISVLEFCAMGAACMASLPPLFYYILPMGQLDGQADGWGQSIWSPPPALDKGAVRLMDSSGLRESSRPRLRSYGSMRCLMRACMCGLRSMGPWRITKEPVGQASVLATARALASLPRWLLKAA